ncbi:hypothetical protein [Parashewanella tropica]|uniref:hypothetical protein n=1 Tax=Parashewanella tropica TaxID=2547970 RepID=UPI001059CD3C|nr:hypothetical protein [Parashewanella tropica]
MSFILNCTIGNNEKCILSINSLFFTPLEDDSFELAICCVDELTGVKKNLFYNCSYVNASWCLSTQSTEQALTDDWFKEALHAQLPTMTLKRPDDIEQHGYAIKRWEILKQEDIQAHQILIEPFNRDLIHQVAKALLSIIEAQPALMDEEFASFVYERIRSKSDRYPTPHDFKRDEDISYREYLIYYLHTQIDSSEVDSHIKLMCLIWLMPSTMLSRTDDAKSQALLDTYHCQVVTKREHIHDDAKTTSSGGFGNTQMHFEQQLFKNIKEHCHYADECRYPEHPQTPYVCKLIEAGLPYVSGVSGMANSFSAIFPLLNIRINSEQGKKLQEIIKAFIVGGAMHSMIEVEHSFAISEQLFNDW